MLKKVILELDIESDFDSAIYARLGDLLADIEDSEFRVKNVKVEDYPLVTIPALRKEEFSRTVNDAVKRSTLRSSY